MQYLRQGTTAVVPVDAGLPLYKNGVAAGSIGSDGLTAVDTDTCGRLDVGSREFMVLAQPVYDALVTGASLLPADAQRTVTQRDPDRRGCVKFADTIQLVFREPVLNQRPH